MTEDERDFLRDQLAVREDRQVWELVRHELGDSYVVGSLASGTGAMGGHCFAAPKELSESEQMAKRERAKKTAEALRIGFHRYDEIFALGEDEVKRLYEEMKRLKVAQEQAQYVEQKRLAVDVEHWAAMPYWSWEEGVAIVHGLTPDRMKTSGQDKVALLAQRWPLFKSYIQTMERARRSVRAGDLRRESRPHAFLTWAVNHCRFEIDQNLLEIASAFGPIHKFTREKCASEGVESAESPPQTDESSRERRNRYALIACLVEVLKERDRKPFFTSQNDLIDHLLEWYKGVEGVSRTTLIDTLSEANKALASIRDDNK